MHDSRSLTWSRQRLVPTALAVVGAVLALIAVFVPPPIGVGIVTLGLLGLAALAVPVIAPLALVLSVPVQDIVRIPVGSLGLTATQLALAGTAVLLPLVIVQRRAAVHVPGIAQLLVAFLLVQVVSLTVASNVLLGVATIYRWAAALLSFLAVIHLLDSRRSVVLLAVSLAVAAVGEVAFGTVQSALGLAPPSFAVAAGLYRAYGTFGQPNPYGGYLEMVGLWLLPLSLWSLSATVLLARRYRRLRWRGFVAAATTRRRLVLQSLVFVTLSIGVLASLVGIILSFSRGAWVGTAAGLAALLLFAPKTVRRIGLVGAFLGAIILLAGGWQQLPEPIRERAVQLVTQTRPFDVRDVQLTGENWAVVERMVHWQAAWGMFLDHPLTGVGAGNFGVAFPDYSPHPVFRIARGHAHNYYLHVLAELGLPGLIVYVGLLMSAVLTMLAVVRRRTVGFDRAVALGALAATVAVAVHNLVENLHELHLSVHLLALWGLAWRARWGWSERVVD